MVAIVPDNSILVFVGEGGPHVDFPGNCVHVQVFLQGFRVKFVEFIHVCFRHDKESSTQHPVNSFPEEGERLHLLNWAAARNEEQRDILHFQCLQALHSVGIGKHLAETGVNVGHVGCEDVWLGEVHDFGFAIHQGNEAQCILLFIPVGWEVNRVNTADLFERGKGADVEGDDFGFVACGWEFLHVGVVGEQDEVDIQIEEGFHPFNAFFNRKPVVW